MLQVLDSYKFLEMYILLAHFVVVFIIYHQFNLYINIV